MLEGEKTGLRNHGTADHTALTLTVPSAAASAAAPGQGRKRGRPSAQQYRPVLRSTNQADPDRIPKPANSSRSLRRHQQHGLGDDDDDHELIDPVNCNADGNDLDAPMHVRVESTRPPNQRRRGSAADPHVLGGSQPPAKASEKHHPPMSTTKTVPIMSQSPSRTVRISDHVAANTSKPFVPPISNSVQQSPPRPAKKQPPAKIPEQRKSSIVERNIDKVVLGNVCFSTWYHSPYGTEALGEISGNSVKTSSLVNGIHDGPNKEEGLAHSSRRTKEDKIDRLYVCPCCFKYSKELVPWWQHVHLCEKRGYVPGKKIYSHPKGQRSLQDSAGSSAAKAPIRKKRAVGVAPQADEEDVDEEGEWSVWEVDGEEEVLFCQNLSLFAKLFLDNKSVFFDVLGFNYFLLVHTTPRQSSDDPAQPLPPRHQVVGFFSKERLSWDNNNLACILVFPPWQRKGLGALLMGVSYEISRREGLLGGPEKPISDLGKKGYKRFWAGEIASWLLELDTSGDDEVVVDVDECSRATWIVPEDCLMMLREMSVVEEAEPGPPPKKKRLTIPSSEESEEAGEAVVGETEQEQVPDVPRVRVSKEAVWAWVQANRISLEKACDPDGFVEGYTIKRKGTEDAEL